jgi:hypothetical protein
MLTNKHTNKHICRQTDKQTYMHTHEHTYIHTIKHTYIHTDIPRFGRFGRETAAVLSFPPDSDTGGDGGGGKAAGNPRRGRFWMEEDEGTAAVAADNAGALRLRHF